MLREIEKCRKSLLSCEVLDDVKLMFREIEKRKSQVMLSQC